MTNEEINRLVAEKVMGWKLTGEYWYDEKNESSWTLHGNADYDIPPFNPSTDISAAWEVVEKVKEHDIEIDYFSDKWFVRLASYGKEGFSVSESNKSISMAICLAALKAVGVEVE